MSDQKQEVGALWKKKSERTGTEYFTGNVAINGEKVNVIAFFNGQKTKDTHPDIRIYLDEGRSGGGNYQKPAAQSRAQETPVRRDPTPAPEPIEYPKEEINIDDIPF